MGTKKLILVPMGTNVGAVVEPPPLWKMSIASRFFSRCTPLWPQQPFFGQNISLKNKTWYTELLVPENAPRNLWNSSRVKITSFCDSCISYRLRQHLFWTKFSFIFYNCGIDIVITFWLKKSNWFNECTKVTYFLQVLYWGEEKGCHICILTWPT